MYEMERASDYPGYDGPSVENGFLDAVDDVATVAITFSDGHALLLKICV